VAPRTNELAATSFALPHAQTHRQYTGCDPTGEARPTTRSRPNFRPVNWSLRLGESFSSNVETFMGSLSAVAFSLQKCGKFATFSELVVFVKFWIAALFTGGCGNIMLHPYRVYYVRHADTHQPE
jgi:hypothetical protein